ncbi:unnamed protein product [Brachionus calyciflorus]|uniref:Lipoprotein n=1 Tax=Brachionus calyciflorus TaxID=104777 RepID=A0A813TGR1_9BILA|nr:unnamed protein product [Brachionus calyciflorus]
MTNISFFITLIGFVFLMSCVGIKCEEQEQLDLQNEKPKNAEEFKNLYVKMLINKRKTQQDAVKRILELGDKKKEKEMLKLVLNKLFDTLKNSLETLAKKSDGKSESLKLDQSTISDVSSVIENTAFAADLSLHFPKYFHKVYDKNKNWQFTLEAAIGVTLQTGLIDEQTGKAINLMSQELNIIDKEADFANPYSQKKVVEDSQPEPQIKKKKEKKKRGPGLSGGKVDL